MDFDGIDDYIDVYTGSYGPTTSDDFTIMMWVYPLSEGFIIGQFENFVPENSNFFLSIYPESSFTIVGNGSNNISFGNPIYNQWQHIAVSIDNSGETKCYQDGFLVGTGDLSLSENNSTMELKIGHHSDDDHYEGMINEIGIFKSVLDESEIQNYINSNFSSDLDNLIGYWKFNSGDGDILYDHSGNQNHGTIEGATWEEIIEGCSDPLAENYNVNANYDDGSCEYPSNGDYSLNFDGVDDYVGSC